MTKQMGLHEFLDWGYGPDGDRTLVERIRAGIDANEVVSGETPLHVATRRRRLKAVESLLDAGAEIDQPNLSGKTAFAHAVRRGFGEIADLLRTRGADDGLALADQFAVAVATGKLSEARALLAQDPVIIRTGNPEEDRLLADMAGRGRNDVVEFLIDAGADLRAPGLDDGSPLHQAAWFGQAENARSLVTAGAPLDLFDRCHQSSPLGWATHGSRYSGGAEAREVHYVAVTQILVEAGSSMCYPEDTSDAYLQRLLKDASPGVRKILEGVPDDA